MKRICKLFGHKWRWVIAYKGIFCIRCGLNGSSRSINGHFVMEKKILKSI